MSTKGPTCSPPARCRSWSCRPAISGRSPHGPPASATGSDLLDKGLGMAGRCERCGSPGSPSGAPASCAACQLPAHPLAPGALVAAASWLPRAGRADREGNLGAILRGYRHAGGLTQQHLADLLGFDRTYISMIERGRRSVTDRGTLTHIARTLAIPPHVLGIAGP